MKRRISRSSNKSPRKRGKSNRYKAKLAAKDRKRCSRVAGRKNTKSARRSVGMLR